MLYFEHFLAQFQLNHAYMDPRELQIRIKTHLNLDSILMLINNDQIQVCRQIYITEVYRSQQQGSKIFIDLGSTATTLFFCHNRLYLYDIFCFLQYNNKNNKCVDNIQQSPFSNDFCKMSANIMSCFEFGHKFIQIFLFKVSTFEHDRITRQTNKLHVPAGKLNL